MRIFTVDAFSDRPFRGNPAGVCLLDGPATTDWMQSVAAELRHAETAFIYSEADGHLLRWFTPTVEVALCGHATLATAHVLYSLGATGSLTFETRGGTLRTERGSDGMIRMDFPAQPVTPVEPPTGLAEALRVSPVGVWRGEFDLLVEVESARAVRRVAPDFARLARIDARGAIVTAASDPADGPDVDFVSRFFAPACGVDEDPVTGSAHCALAPFWGDRFGRLALIGAQLSARGGIVRATRHGDRVELAGHAVTIWSGNLHV
jgi:PhzF family phenazine biosynthesis protein